MASNRIRLIIRPVLALAALAAVTSFLGCGAADPYEVPESPFRIVAKLALPSHNEGITARGEYVFVAGGEAGLHTISLADPTAPVLLQTVNTNKLAESVEVVRVLDGGRIWDVAIVVEATEGLDTYDVTDPAAPLDFEQGGGAYDAQRIFVKQGEDPGDPYLVFMADSWRGLRLFESVTGTPGAHVQLANAVYSNGYTKDVWVRGDYAYVADDEMGLAVFDVSNPDFVEMVSWSDTRGYAYGVCLDGDYAFVADHDWGMTVFRIDGAAAPEKVAEIDLSARCQSVVVRNGWCLLACERGGVRVVDVSDPEDPVDAGTIDTQHATELAITDSGHVVVSDRFDGLVVLQGPDMRLDETPPGKITTATATPLDFTQVRLDWLAVGDDGLLGEAAAYEVRHADAPIVDAAAWDAATPVVGTPVPGAAGSAETLVVDGFSAGQTVHFALRAVDDEDQEGAISASIAVTLLDDMILVGAGVDSHQNVPTHEFVFETRYFNVEGRAPTAAADVVIDGERMAMILIEGDPLTGALYRYTGFLELGTHSFHFDFDDGMGLAYTTDAEDIYVLPRISFTMGSPLDEPGREEDEGQFSVGLLDSIIVEPHEVTQAEWEAAGFVNASRFTGSDRPVENVTWFDAVEYCNQRSLDDGLDPCYVRDGFSVDWDRSANGWRLPTEAEWEWFARGDVEAPLSNMSPTDQVIDGDWSPYLDSVGWYEGNATATADVEQLAANPFGYYDVHGNVWEWCWDWYGDYPTEPSIDPTGPETGDRRVIRGGSWHYRAADCRSASRGAYYPTSADDFVGLRVVRTAGGGE